MNLLIVDDHEIIRDGISMIMEQSFHIDAVKSASDGYEALRLVESFYPDLVLLDISMPNGLDGFSTLARLRNLIPEAKIVIFSMYDSIAYKKKAYKYGASGFLIKQLKKDDFLQSLDQILFNQKVFHHHRLSSEEKAVCMSDLDLPITKREKDVFILTVEGHTIKETAKKLGISVKTVENHRQNITKKLGTSERHKWIDLARKYIKY